MKNITSLNKFSLIAVALIAMGSLSNSAMAYTLSMVPVNHVLALGFTPGMPLTKDTVAGSTETDTNHAKTAYTQLEVRSPVYNAQNNIGVISFDQQAQKATVQCQQSAWGELYNIDVIYNGTVVGSCETNGTSKIDLAQFTDSAVVTLNVSQINVSQIG
tara:strand:+ start:40812 stop:41288 length:477 start_codon:yes stop_codon:yes gene_type:complete